MKNRLLISCLFMLPSLALGNEVHISLESFDIGGTVSKYEVSFDGSISTEIMHDKLHLTGKGYKIWDDALLPEIRKYLNTQPE